MNLLVIAVEGVEVLSPGFNSMANASGLLLACFYVFDISYPLSCTNLFLLF